MKLAMRVTQSFAAFCQAFGIPLFPWQREAFGGATERVRHRVVRHRFRYRVAGISVPRGNGKTHGDAGVGLWRLLTGPTPQDIITAALDMDGADVMLDHARRMVRSHPELERAIEIRASSLLVPATGSRWTITSREHTASRGRHPTLVIYDEIGWARDDELFASLLAGQASVADPLMLVTSTVGRRQSGPLWTVKTLAEQGDDAVLWWYRTENLSPLVTAEFLARQKRILLPNQYAREHENAWVSAADSLTDAAQVDAAMSTGWTEPARGDGATEYVAFVDLGAVHDPTVVAIGHAEAGPIYIDRLVTMQGSREEPVQFEAVERIVRDLAARFRCGRIRVESWQGFASAQRLQALGLPVEIFTPTAKTNAEEWPVLAQHLAAGTIVLPPHPRLREELLNLTYDVGPQGVRVTDKGKVHQDHAVAVRGVVAMVVQMGMVGAAMGPELEIIGGHMGIPAPPAPTFTELIQELRGELAEQGLSDADIAQLQERMR